MVKEVLMEVLMDSNSFSFPKEHYREVQPAGGAQPNPSHSHCGIILHTYPDGGGGLQLAVIDFADSVTICMIHCDTRVKQKKNKKKHRKSDFPEFCQEIPSSLHLACNRKVLVDGAKSRSLNFINDPR